MSDCINHERHPPKGSHMLGIQQFWHGKLCCDLQVNHTTALITAKNRYCLQFLHFETKLDTISLRLVPQIYSFNFYQINWYEL